MNYLAINEAARRLATTPKALRARCLRATGGSRRVAQLAPGVTAIKLGRLWRVRFEEQERAAS